MSSIVIADPGDVQAFLEDHINVYFDFEEGSGSTTNSSEGNEWSGVFGNTPHFETGKIGDYCMEFDSSSSDYITIDDEDSPLWRMNPRTVFVWLRLQSYKPSNQYFEPVVKRVTSVPRSGFQLISADSPGASPTKFGAYLWSTPTWAPLIPSTPNMDINNWKLIVLCAMNGSQAIYMNNTVQATDSVVTMDLGNLVDLTLGNNPGLAADNFYDGQMDTLAFVDGYICNDSTIMDWLWNDGDGNELFPAITNLPSDVYVVNNSVNFTSDGGQICGYSGTKYTVCGPSTDLTPTFKFDTLNTADCKIWNTTQNFTTLDSLGIANCSTTSATSHQCTFPATLKRQSANHTLYISCKSGEYEMNTFVDANVLQYSSSPCFLLQSTNGSITDGGTISIDNNCVLILDTLRIDTGRFLLEPTGLLRSNGCFVKDEQQLHIMDGGKMYCES